MPSSSSESDSSNPDDPDSSTESIVPNELNKIVANVDPSLLDLFANSNDSSSFAGFTESHFQTTTRPNPPNNETVPTLQLDQNCSVIDSGIPNDGSNDSSHDDEN